MRRLSAALSSAVLLLSAAVAHADLTGSQVTGTVHFGGGTTNFFLASNGGVPAGYGNSSGSATVTIGPIVEFGYADVNNTDTADFTGTGLTVSDQVTGGASPETYIFTDVAFGDPSFTGFSIVSNTLGATYSLVGDTLTIQKTSQTNGNADLSIVLAVNPPAVAATPEPNSLVLLGTGALGFAGAARRKFLKR